MEILASMSMACSPSALVVLAVALLMFVSASPQAQAFTPLPAPSGPTRAPRQPTPAPSPALAPPPTPAAAPAPSSQVCPTTGFSSLKEFKEAFDQYAARRIFLVLVPAGSPESGTHAISAKLRRAGLIPCVCRFRFFVVTGPIQCEDA
ncbi:hypothetical protein GQ55_6G076400 [Panicum hallii var. hallii]|uniref:Uncharacterized protein n=1 Tax=Panicum hallii var. hallii TaxID=1504633 RepID=A0A2T7D535_9POAL|nr:hypothetical protein GQ55_6G076400 [Panicum hallii var. hallii]